MTYGNSLRPGIPTTYGPMSRDLQRLPPPQPTETSVFPMRPTCPEDVHHRRHGPTQAEIYGSMVERRSPARPFPITATCGATTLPEISGPGFPDRTYRMYPAAAPHWASRPSAIRLAHDLNRVTGSAAGRSGCSAATASTQTPAASSTTCGNSFSDSAVRHGAFHETSGFADGHAIPIRIAPSKN